MVFETGLPTRYYVNRTEVDFTHLAPTNTLTACPYKGTASGYWTAHLGDTSYSDIAWTYDFPTRQLLPIEADVPIGTEYLAVSELGGQFGRDRLHRREHDRLVDVLMRSPLGLGVVGFETFVELQGLGRPAAEHLRVRAHRLV